MPKKKKNENEEEKEPEIPNPLSPSKIAKFSAVYWLLYSAYKGVQELYSKKGKKRSKLWAILSIIFPLLLLWAFYIHKDED